MGDSSPHLSAGCTGAEGNGETHSTRPPGVSARAHGCCAQGDVSGANWNVRSSWCRAAPDRSSTTNPIAGLDEDDAPPMDDRIGQRQIAVVLGVEEVELRRRMPFTQLHARLSPPSEGAGRLGLVDAVDDDGAVCRGAAEEVAPLRLAGVAVGSGIHEARFAEHRALNAQQVGVPMAAAHRTADRTDVHDGLVSVGGPSRCASRRSRLTGRRATGSSRAAPGRGASNASIRVSVPSATRLLARARRRPRRSRAGRTRAAATRKPAAAVGRGAIRAAAAGSRRRHRQCAGNVAVGLPNREQELAPSAARGRDMCSGSSMPFRSASSRKCR